MREGERRRRERENTPNLTQKGNCTQISLFESALLFKLSRFCKLWCIGIFHRMECRKIGKQTNFENIYAEELNKKVKNFYAKATLQHNKKRANQISSEQISENN